MSKKVADLLIETLAKAGIQRIYGLAGDSLNGITDSIRKNGTIDWVHVRHEETAAFAAGAEAQLTGNLTVCAGSCGPGNLHLINGLYDCQRSRVPVLVIASHIPSHEIGTGYFQETHPELLFKECSHYCELVSDPNQLPRTLEIAMRTAISKRGVAVVVLPGDISLKDCVGAISTISAEAPQTIAHPVKSDLKQAATILNAAKKITILGGAGCADAQSELIALAKKLKAPIVHTLRGKEFVEPNNPFDVGLTGLLGMPAGYHAIEDCDALLMLGTDFPYRQFYPKHAKIIQVDVRGEQIGRRVAVNVGLVGDVKNTIQALLPLVSRHFNGKHLDKALQHHKHDEAKLAQAAVNPPESKTIHPQYVASLLNELAASDAIFSCDVGTPTIWAARYLHMTKQRRLLGSFVHGSMANALPQAIGAQATYPNRQVISMSGDGGLAMLLGDILTLKQAKLPVKIIVFNNHALGFVELEMKAAGFLDFATELENPNFAKMAEAAGILGLRVTKPAEVRDAITKALAHPGPALIDITVNRQELILPPTITKEEVVGFNMFLFKAMLDHRGHEIIDLAKSNLIR